MDNKILISRYKSVTQKNGSHMSIPEFIMGIRDGLWQDDVLSVRNAKSKTESDAIKKRCDAVTVSGIFDTRSIAGLRHHSGFIAMDVDNIENPNKAKKLVEKDPYVYAAFVSISGKGLCLMFRIDPAKHRESFEALDKYLYENYSFICDKSCVDVSRLRIVSYDPYIHINEDAQVFKKYLPKPKRIKQQQKVVFVNTDFDQIVKSIYDRGLNICEDYSDWLRVCYAIVGEYGDTNTGRDHFDTLSRHSSKYNEKDCLKQYNACLKTHNDSKKKVSTIAFIYDIAKRNGIETYSIETKEVIRSAASQSKTGVSKQDIAKGLEKFNDIPEAKSLPIIQQVISLGIEHQTENIIDDIIHFLQPYGLRKNLVTRNVEMNGNPLDDSDINTLFIDCKSLFDKATKDLVCSVIFSNKTEQYHPIKEFLDSSTTPINGTPNLDLLLDSINTDTPNYRTWITKWLVSMIAAANDQYSPLLLVLCGEVQGTGKTEFFRRLLPKQLRYLFGESKMDGGKDDEILMTKKWIIFDDEFGGKSKREEKRLKEITSKEFINVREPYGRVSVDLRRLSVFCGSSNDNQVLSDPTGNRRILPIHILSIDHDKYNSSNKEMLFHEINYLYKSGYDWRILKEDIEKLNESTGMFTLSTPEEELISAKIKPCENEYIGEWMSITQIIQYVISDTKYNNMSNTRIGMILTRVGYKKVRKKINGMPTTLYLVEKITDFNTQGKSDNPF